MMKLLSPSIFTLFFAGYVYTQAFNVAMDSLKRMNALMGSAATQMQAIDTNSNKTLI